jgi:hypothetical protein
MPAPFTVNISPFTLAAVTASTHGTAGPYDCQGWGSLSAMLSVTTGTPTAASITNFRVWLQGQFNSGGQWNDLPFLSVTKSFITGSIVVATAGVTTTNATVLAAEGAVTSAFGFNYWGRMNAPPPLVRVAYIITAVSGAPFITFGVEGVLSQIAAP